MVCYVFTLILQGIFMWGCLVLDTLNLQASSQSAGLWNCQLLGDCFKTLIYDLIQKDKAPPPANIFYKINRKMNSRIKKFRETSHFCYLLILNVYDGLFNVNGWSQMGLYLLEMLTTGV